MMTKAIFAIVLVAFIAVWFTFRQADTYREFLKKAEKTQGVVLKKEERATGQKNNRKELWITYSYDTRGRTHTAQELLEYPDLWQGIRQGHPVDIYYNRENPGESHLAMALDRRLGIATALKKH